MTGRSLKTSTEALKQACPTCGYLRDVAVMDQPCPRCHQIERQLEPLATDVAQGRARKAIPKLVEMSAKYGRHVELQRLLATAYSAVRRHSDALDTWGRVTTLEPQNADAFFSLSQAYSRLGRHAEARSALEKTLELSPDHAQAKIELSGVEERLKQREAAVAAGRAPSAGVSPGGKSPVLAAVLALLFHGSGQLYLGQTVKGIVFLIAWLLWNAVALIFALTAIGLVVAVPMWAVSGLFGIGHAIDGYLIGSKMGPGQLPAPWSFFQP